MQGQTRVRTGMGLCLFFRLLYLAPGMCLAAPASDQKLERISQLKDPKKQAEMLEAFLKSKPDSKRAAKAHSLAVHAYHRLDNADKIIEHGEQFLRLQPSNPNNLRLLVLLARVCGERLPSNTHYKAKAELYLQTFRKLYSNIEEIEKLYGAQPSKEETRLLARYYSTLGRISLLSAHAANDSVVRNAEAGKAIIAYDAALALNREDALSWYRLGQAYLQQDRPDESIIPMAKAVALRQSPISEAVRRDLERSLKNTQRGSAEGLGALLKHAEQELKLATAKDKTRVLPK